MFLLPNVVCFALFIFSLLFFIVFVLSFAFFSHGCVVGRLKAGRCLLLAGEGCELLARQRLQPLEECVREPGACPLSPSPPSAERVLFVQNLPHPSSDPVDPNVNYDVDAKLAANHLYRVNRVTNCDLDQSEY